MIEALVVCEKLPELGDLRRASKTHGHPLYLAFTHDQAEVAMMESPSMIFWGDVEGGTLDLIQWSRKKNPTLKMVAMSKSLPIRKQQMEAGCDIEAPTSQAAVDALIQTLSRSEVA